MSAVDISGPGGSLTLSGYNIVSHVSGWSASLTGTAVETTGFQELGWRTYAITALVMSGAFDGTGQGGVGTLLPVSGSGPSMSAMQASMVLYADSTHTFSFTAAITNLNLSRRFDGKLDISGNFLSDGAVTVAGT